MNTAAKVRAAKEKNPENFCRDPLCLWRTVTRDGMKPCPKHTRCPHCKDTHEIVVDHPVFGPEVTPCPDCEEFS